MLAMPKANSIKINIYENIFIFFYAKLQYWKRH